MKRYSILDILRRRAVPALAGLAGLAVTGCVAENGLCPPDGDGDNSTRSGTVWLSLDIAAPAPMTRTAPTRADDAAGHPELAGTVAESTIDPSAQTQLLLFDGNGLVLKAFDRDDFVLTADGSAGQYKLTFGVNADYFGYADGKDNVDFSLLLLANMNKASDRSALQTGFDHLDWAKTPAGLAQELRGFSYTGQETPGSQWPWLPTLDNNPTRLIPMSGMKKFSVPHADLNASDEGDNRVQLGQIDMQRNLAKIVVYDNLSAKGDKDAKINGLRLIGGNSHGAFLPDIAGNPAWATGTVAVETAATSADWWDASRRRDFDKDGGNKELGEDAEKYNTVYLTEYDPAVSGEQLQIEIEWQSDDRHHHTETYTWDELTKQTGGVIARNHVYLLECNSPDMYTLSFNLTAMDWNRVDEDLDFSDHPSVEKTIWQNVTGEGTTKIIAGATTARAGIKITSPMNCKWTARIAPGQGGANRFKFTEPDHPDAEHSWTLVDNNTVTGYVDGNTHWLYITPTSETVDQDVTAYLCVYVETLDGQILEVNLVTEGGGRFELMQTKS